MIFSFIVNEKTLYKKIQCMLTYKEMEKRRVPEILIGKEYKIIKEKDLYGINNLEGVFVEFDSLKRLVPDSHVLVLESDGKPKPNFYKVLDPVNGIICVHKLCLSELDN
jgi:hypothetical protein